MEKFLPSIFYLNSSHNSYGDNQNVSLNSI